MDDSRGFQTAQERDEFWARIDSVIADYPSLLNGLDAIYEGDDDSYGDVYNPMSPKVVTGRVLILGCANLENWESFIVIDPQDQSVFIKDGLIANAASNI